MKDVQLNRQQQFKQLQQQSDFDVVILGAGINGSCLFDRLSRLGYRVLIVDKNDFSSGTSQASGMMIWGGLLYLKDFDLRTVFQLSQDRDSLILEKAKALAPRVMRYLPSHEQGRARWWVHLGLWAYWLMGMGRRGIPRSASSFSESALLKPGLNKGSLTYEEAFLDQSDARFTYDWIAPHLASGQCALNYCQVEGSHSAADRKWHLQVEDKISGRQQEIRSAMIINCAGIWTDQVNADFHIRSPFKHVFSKGVYLGIPRAEEHRSSLFFDLGEHDDVITHVPWGPISLWGPTETTVKHIAEGLHPSKEDIDFLLDQYGRRYRTAIDRSDIISTRCGIRPLVVDSDYQEDRYPLELSRRNEVVQDAERPWISCYGGKLTGCTRLAERVSALVQKSLAASGNKSVGIAPPSVPATHTMFPGLTQPVVSAVWAAEHELCCTLEDYLRRRTNIAQWVPRGGFGFADANAPALRGIALELAIGDPVLADQLFENYRSTIKNSVDALLC